MGTEGLRGGASEIFQFDFEGAGAPSLEKLKTMCRRLMILTDQSSVANQYHAMGIRVSLSL
jgi:hypothetical protein